MDSIRKSRKVTRYEKHLKNADVYNGRIGVTITVISRWKSVHNNDNISFERS